MTADVGFEPGLRGRTAAALIHKFVIADARA